MTTFREDNTFGWELAIPEPYWKKNWFRWKPSCYDCQVIFDTQEQWEDHWIKNHYEG